MKRKRHVFPTHEIAHIWANAHELQGQARNPQDNFYFIGASIYSYGGHFEIARHYKGMILFTVNTYGSTTGNHIRDVSWAIRHLDHLSVRVFPQPTYSDRLGKYTDREHRTNIEYYVSRIVHYAEKHSRARKYSYESETLSWQATLQRYVKAFRCKRLLKASQRRLHDAEGMEPLSALTDSVRLAQRNLVRLKARKEKEATEALKQQQINALNQWAEGGRISYGYGYYSTWSSLPVRLRIKNDTIETSHGATVPLEACPQVLVYCQRCRAANVGWIANGEAVRIGHYQIDRIEADGSIVAGCHRIAWDELERIAIQLGWI